MIDLRDALHDAVPDEVDPLDHEVLHSRAARRRTRGRLGTGVVVAGTAALVVAVATTGLPQTSQPGLGIDSGIEAVSAADQEAFREWRAERVATVEREVAQAPEPQQAALADGVVTEKEWVASAQRWAECAREKGFPISMFRQTGDHGYPGGWGFTSRTGTEEFDTATDACWEQHHRAIDALWQEQQTDHVAVWNWMKEMEETAR